MSGARRGALGGKLTALAAGALFGVGLLVAGMTDPAKVKGFLDVTGAWDASLAFVMVGAIGVHLALLRRITRLANPLFDARFHLPSRRDIDGRLLAGAAIFGVGWGLGGVCPGPSFVLAGTGSAYALVFVAAMGVGAALVRARRAGAATANGAGANGPISAIGATDAEG